MCEHSETMATLSAVCLLAAFTRSGHCGTRLIPSTLHNHHPGHQIRVTVNGKIRKYVEAAKKVLRTEGKNQIVVFGEGRAVTKAISCAEVLKHRVRLSIDHLTPHGHCLLLSLSHSLSCTFSYSIRVCINQSISLAKYHDVEAMGRSRQHMHPLLDCSRLSCEDFSSLGYRQDCFPLCES